MKSMREKLQIVYTVICFYKVKKLILCFLLNPSALEILMLETFITNEDLQQGEIY